MKYTYNLLQYYYINYTTSVIGNFETKSHFRSFDNYTTENYRRFLLTLHIFLNRFKLSIFPSPQRIVTVLRRSQSMLAGTCRSSASDISCVRPVHRWVCPLCIVPRLWGAGELGFCWLKRFKEAVNFNLGR